MAEVIRVLIVDDEEDFRQTLATELTRKKIDIKQAESASRAISILAKDDIDVALIDIRMPKVGGIELVSKIRALSPETEMVMLTGYGTMENAIEAMKAGASDFLRKPCHLMEIQVAIQSAYEKKVLKRQNKLLKNELNRKERHPELIGKSRELNDVFTIIDKVAPTDSTVLILGESGVGKELVARSIHRNSKRGSQPFIIMDCCSLSETLLQSELFGHEKGAYTGATSLKHGLFEVADKGTIFIDEIGEISPAIQSGLLRVLETGCFRRLGGVKDMKVDVRILAATNRDLMQAIKNGIFREDLFYRLNVVSITVPPLREHSSDIPSLVEHALQTSRIPGARHKQLSDSAMDILKTFHWPGNVRELLNVIERATILSDNEIIQPQDLPLPHLSRPKSFTGFDDDLSLDEMNMAYIEWIMQKTGGNRKRAAEILKIDSKTLYRKLKNKDNH
jgi:DNA-binding NtrC family response regulator